MFKEYCLLGTAAPPNMIQVIQMEQKLQPFLSLATTSDSSPSLLNLKRQAVNIGKFKLTDASPPAIGIHFSVSYLTASVVSKFSSLQYEGLYYMVDCCQLFPERLSIRDSDQSLRKQNCRYPAPFIKKKKRFVKIVSPAKRHKKKLVQYTTSPCLKN